MTQPVERCDALTASYRHQLSVILCSLEDVVEVELIDGLKQRTKRRRRRTESSGGIASRLLII